jgi:hypothetical protein
MGMCVNLWIIWSVKDKIIKQCIKNIKKIEMREKDKNKLKIW